MTESTELDNTDPKIRVATKLLSLLQKYLGDEAPTGVGIVSDSKDHVLLRFQYDAGNFDSGRQLLNNQWIFLSISLGCHGSSFLPNPRDHSVESTMRGISLDKLDRMLDKKMLEDGLSLP